MTKQIFSRNPCPPYSPSCNSSPAQGVEIERNPTEISVHPKEESQFNRWTFRSQLK